MKYFFTLIVIITTGCSAIPVSEDGDVFATKPTRKQYSLEDKIENCVYKFIERFGTEIEKTYKVCYGIHKNKEIK